MKTSMMYLSTVLNFQCVWSTDAKASERERAPKFNVRAGPCRTSKAPTLEVTFKFKEEGDNSKCRPCPSVNHANLELDC